jgi:hypothetical protein
VRLKRRLTAEVENLTIGGDRFGAAAEKRRDSQRQPPRRPAASVQPRKPARASVLWLLLLGVVAAVIVAVTTRAVEKTSHPDPVSAPASATPESLQMSSAPVPADGDSSAGVPSVVGDR